MISRQRKITNKLALSDLRGLRLNTSPTWNPAYVAPLFLQGSYYKLAVLGQYILERYASSSKGRSLTLDPVGPASTS